jgi:hypothetical protein
MEMRSVSPEGLVDEIVGNAGIPVIPITTTSSSLLLFLFFLLRERAAGWRRGARLTWAGTWLRGKAKRGRPATVFP